MQQGEEKQKGKSSSLHCHSMSVTLANTYFSACLRGKAQPCLKSRQLQQCIAPIGSSLHAGLAGAGMPARIHPSLVRVVAGCEVGLHAASFHPCHNGLGAEKQNKARFCAGTQPPPQAPQGLGWRGVCPGVSGGCSGIMQQHFAPSARDQALGNFLAQRGNHVFCLFEGEDLLSSFKTQWY